MSPFKNPPREADFHSIDLNQSISYLLLFIFSTNSSMAVLGS